MRLYILTICLLLTIPALSQVSISSKEVTNALSILNKTRKDAGLDTVSISATLSNGCYNHAKYLVLNKDNPLTSGMSAHKEFPQLKAYSKEGEVAGKNAVINYIKLTDAVTGWVQTFYHRIPLLQPNLKEVGIGYYEKDGYVVSLIECISGTKGEYSKDIVCYPNENQIEVPLQMGPEIPHPVGEQGNYGFPITIYFTKWQNVINVNFKLTDSNNKVIDCYVSTPEKPATYFDQWNSVCAIPKTPLSADTKYIVTVTCSVNGTTFKKMFNFQTITK